MSILEIMKKLIYLIATVPLVTIVSFYTLNLTTMKNLETEITINANSQEVWKVLMDHQEYPNWNPFIKHISGNTTQGENLNVTIHPEGKAPIDFTPVVLINKEQKEFRWLGHLFVKGLFDGEHYFKLEASGPNQIKFIHGENFSGLLSGALMKMIGNDTKQGFITMNEALKFRVEKLNNK
jgi:hypothetical protein